MIKVKARPGEVVAVLLRRFKKACDNERLKDAMKRAAYYEKPSDKQRAQEEGAVPSSRCQSRPDCLMLTHSPLGRIEQWSRRTIDQ